jgi:glutathione S-transferase
VTRLAQADYKALHPMGAAPVIRDGDVVLAESGAIVEYIVAKYGKGRLVLPPDHPDFAQFVYWLHFANGTLQPAMGRNMILGRLDLPADNPMLRAMKGRLDLALDLVEGRLAKAEWIGGKEFTIADIMIVFSLTTMRLFLPLDLKPYPAILAYLQRVGKRDAYRHAMAKGDPDLEPLLT